MKLVGAIVDSARPPAKFQATLNFIASGGRLEQRQVVFGLINVRDPNNDYPHHHDIHRTIRYLIRHGATRLPRFPHENETARVASSSKEDWGSSGVLTPGWWSRWFLWSWSRPHAILRQLRELLRVPVHITSRALRQLTHPYCHTQH